MVNDVEHFLVLICHPHVLFSEMSLYIFAHFILQHPYEGDIDISIVQTRKLRQRSMKVLLNSRFRI